MLKARSRLTWIVEPEAQRARTTVRQIRDDGIVRVHHDRRVGRQVGDGSAPPLRDELELAVAIELVAEEVAEGYHAGSGPR